MNKAFIHHLKVSLKPNNLIAFPSYNHWSNEKQSLCIKTLLCLHLSFQRILHESNLWQLGSLQISTVGNSLIMEMCCANDSHRFCMQWIHQRALNYKMQHFVARCSHKWEREGILQQYDLYVSMPTFSLFLRQQEGTTVAGSKTADFIFKRQNLTSSVKCYWFNHQMVK